MQLVRVGLGLMLLLGVAACATPPTDPAERAAFDETNDPLEPMNRQIFAVNQFADDIFLAPLADIYRTLTPPPIQSRFSNVLDNLRQPLVLTNNLLQGDFHTASMTLGRFAINTVWGVGGLFDVATDYNYPRQLGDFGQTLDRWGAPEGPYLVLPLFGPSNARDAVGLGVDAVADPLSWGFHGAVADDLSYGRAGMGGITQRAEALDPLKELRRNSIDFYATLRSVVRQHRAAELHQGEPQPLSGRSLTGADAKDLYDDPTQEVAKK